MVYYGAVALMNSLTLHGIKEYILPLFTENGVDLKCRGCVLFLFVSIARILQYY